MVKISLEIKRIQHREYSLIGYINIDDTIVYAKLGDDSYNMLRALRYELSKLKYEGIRI